MTLSDPKPTIEELKALNKRTTIISIDAFGLFLVAGALEKLACHPLLDPASRALVEDAAEHFRSAFNAMLYDLRRKAEPALD